MDGGISIYTVEDGTPDIPKIVGDDALDTLKTVGDDALGVPKM